MTVFIAAIRHDNPPYLYLLSTPSIIAGNPETKDWLTTARRMLERYPDDLAAWQLQTGRRTLSTIEEFPRTVAGMTFFEVTLD